ncbi:MAG: hypothetical protein ACJAT2_000855 [Bacteriovoracaceae bacterium]|jgi:hypothetical protein
MKFLVIFIVSLNLTPLFAASLDEAPLEWLVAQSLMQKTDEDGHVTEDKLVKEIFDVTSYDADNDELKITENKRSQDLKSKLRLFLKNSEQRNAVDPLYTKWRNEGTSPINVRTKKVNLKSNGFYFFNHIHTNISQDNDSLKFLKISPSKTIDLVKGFVSLRDTKAVASITDHDTDRGFDQVSHLADDAVQIKRGIEWGGRTHMCLVDIKKDWELLSKGREFQHEESIIKSRSSEGFRIANHPSKKDDFPHTKWLDVDGVEVWNTIMEDAAFRKIPLKKSNNRAALKQWALSLKAGKRHTAVAGSDFHFTIPCLRDRSLHYPANYFPSGSRDDVKTLLKEGRNSIITMPTAPQLNLKASFSEENNWLGMGDNLKGKGELNVLLSADFSHSKTRMRSACYNVISSFTKLFTFWKKRRWEVRFYNINNELIAKETINPKKFGGEKSFVSGFKVQIPAGQKDLIRAELWSINKKTSSVDLLGMTNPIYLN